MSLLKEIINEVINNKVRPGKYDLNGQPLQNIIGSNTIDNKGRKNVNFNFLTGKEVISYLRKTFNNPKIKEVFLKKILENNPNIKNGYAVDAKHNEMLLYSYDRILKTISLLDINNKPMINNQGFYSLNKNYENILNNTPSKSKKDRDRENWEQNVEMRSWYDASEKKDDI